MTFWGQIDTYGTGGYRVPDCKECATGWRYQRLGRNTQQCIALNGRGERCSETGSDSFPFCDRFHAEHAIEAFIAHLASDEGVPIRWADNALHSLLGRLREARGRTHPDITDAVDDEIVHRIETGDTDRIAEQLDHLIQDRIAAKWSYVA